MWTDTNYAAGSVFTPSGDVTLYAHWEVAVYRVIFSANSGTGTVPDMLVETGNSITLPNSGNVSGIYAIFTGWNTTADGSGTDYTENSSFTPTGNISDIILYAQWDITPLSSVTGLVPKLTWLRAHAQSDTSYIIEVDADESTSGGWTLYSGKSNITITLKGIGSNCTVSLSSNGVMFTVSSGVTLVLDNNITLRGRSGNNDSLVRVNSGGTLIMNEGSTITGNITSTSGTSTTSSPYGGGVYVGGTFTMNGGEISGNTTSASADASYSYGGGVFVTLRAIFTMNGGEISGNTATTTTTTRPSGGSGGGGVYTRGTFTMNDGEISRNTATPTSFSFDPLSRGGGVYVSGGTFDKTGGTITGYMSDTVNGNVVKDSSETVRDNYGHAVYAFINSNSIKRKELTAGPGVNLSYNNSTFSGGWDY